MPDEPANLMIEILKQIRDRLDTTNQRLESLEAHTDERLDRMNDRLDRMGQESIRQSTAIVSLEGAVRILADETRTLHQRIDHVLTGPMGTTVRDLEMRMRAVESKLKVG